MLVKSGKWAGALLLASVALTMEAQAQTVVYQETFDNGNVPANATIDIVNYVGPGPLNMTYIADPKWTMQMCNGIVGWYSAPQNDPNAIANCNTGPLPGNSFRNWTWNQEVMLAIGGYNNNEPNGASLNVNSPAVERNNKSLAAMTVSNGELGAPNLILQNATPIPFPAVPAGGTGRFITFSFTSAATTCGGGFVSPLVSVELNGTTLGGTMNLCTGGVAPRTYTVSAPPGTATVTPITVLVARRIPAGASAAPLIMGNNLTFRMINQQPSGRGNDWAWDNFTALDVSPSLSKAVTPAVTYVGVVKTLTFTITNTPQDNLAKVGWAFTDSLPTNVVVAPTPSATTSCGAGTAITATAGAGTISVANGNLPAGTAGGTATTCTISVNVVSNVAGTFTNGPSNFTASTGLNLPAADINMEWVRNTLTVTKISQGDTATFNFTNSNDADAATLPYAIVTTAPGAPGATGPVRNLTIGSTTTNTVISETPPAGWRITGATCTGLAAGQTAAFTATTVTLPSAGMGLVTGGHAVVCTVTNTLTTDLSITKSNTYTAAQPSDLPSDTVTSGATTTYTLVVTNKGPGAVTGAVAHDTPDAGITCPGTNPVTIDYSGTTPDTTSTVSVLSGASGIVLGTLGSAETATLTFVCTVN